MSHDRFWVPHESEVWLPASFLRQEGGGRYFATEHEEIVVQSNEQLEQITDTKALDGVADICELNSITPASILHTVRVRYSRDEIYTNISRILVAVNPFKPLPIYSSQYVDKYRFSDPAGLAPHVFGVAQDAFVGLTEERKGQAVLISGESGAGKSETTKLVLLYASEVFSNSDSGIGDKILEISPILEAFGNAKTCRNTNSSRFGKWIEVRAEPSTVSLCGADITDYLLEVTRVCSQGPGERNYHIFYQLAADSSANQSALKVHGAERFAYLKANPANASGVDDVDGFLQLRKALASLGFRFEEQNEVFRIVAGILHLGNVEFKEEGDGVKLINDDACANSADNFGCCVESLSKCLRFKRLVVGKDVTESPLDKSKAQHARDSMAKLVYGRLFRWIVRRCNEALEADTPSVEHGAFIGVLDIAGFEDFATNMLEQLWINLSNEKLQQFFNELVFKGELADYASEGVDAGKIEFEDNADVVALIEGKGGLLQMLDDATHGVKQTDLIYTTQVTKAHAQNKRFRKPKFPNSPQYSVCHYAGVVTYTTEGFIEKNMGGQAPEVLELLSNSSLLVLRELALDADDAEGPATSMMSRSSTVGRNTRKTTVSLAFRKSLQRLMDKLAASNAHFVRCVKPNAQKVPDNLDARMVMDQLRCSGVFEAVKIRKAGFAFRLLCTDFLKRYLILFPTSIKQDIMLECKNSVVTSDEDAVKMAHKVMERLKLMLSSGLSPADYAIGRTKIFIKASLHQSLERLRHEAFEKPTILIQSMYRGWRVRLTVSQVQALNKQLGKCLSEVGLRGGTGAVIEHRPRATLMETSLATFDMLIDRAQSLPVEPPLLRDALKARARVAAEAKLTRQMQDLQTSVDIPAIEAILARVVAFDMAKGEIVQRLQTRLQTLQVEQLHRQALHRCLCLSLEEIQEAIDQAHQAGLSEEQSDTWHFPDGPELLKEAKLRLELLREERRIAEEDAARRTAEESARRAAEEAATRKAAQEAAQRAAAEVEQVQAKIRQAAAEYDAKALAIAIQLAAELGLPQKEFEREHALFLNMQCAQYLQTTKDEIRQGAFKNDVHQLLQLSNLTEQLENIGFVEPDAHEMRSVTEAMISRSKAKGRHSVFQTNDDTERKIAKKCFNDISNFSRFSNPVLLETRHRALSYDSDDYDDQTGPAPMLQHSLELKQPLTKLDSSLQMFARRAFTNLLRCMGDKPCAYIGDKEQEIIEAARRGFDLCDEIYLQVMRQLTGNPSTESLSKGWHLLQSLCKEVPPSEELAEFLRAFLEKESRRGEDAASNFPDAVNTQRRRTYSSAAEVEMQGVDWSESRRSFLKTLPEQAAETLELLEASMMHIRDTLPDME